MQWTRLARPLTSCCAHRDTTAARRFFERAIASHGAPATVTVDKSGANLVADRDPPEQVFEQPCRARPPGDQAPRQADAGIPDLSLCTHHPGWNRDHAQDPQRTDADPKGKQSVRCRAVLLSGRITAAVFLPAAAPASLSRQNRNSRAGCLRSTRMPPSITPRSSPSANARVVRLAWRTRRLQPFAGTTLPHWPHVTPRSSTVSTSSLPTLGWIEMVISGSGMRTGRWTFCIVGLIDNSVARVVAPQIVPSSAPANAQHAGRWCRVPLRSRFSPSGLC